MDTKSELLNYWNFYSQKMVNFKIVVNLFIFLVYKKPKCYCFQLSVSFLNTNFCFGMI